MIVWPAHRSTCVMAAVTSASDLLAAPSKRSRGLADIDPKFVSNVNIWLATKSLKKRISFLLFFHSDCMDANRVMGTRLLFSLLLMNVVTCFPISRSFISFLLSGCASFFLLFSFLLLYGCCKSRDHAHRQESIIDYYLPQLRRIDSYADKAKRKQN